MPWEDRHEVNTYVARLSAELADRGHRVVVAAPSRDEAAVRAGRRAVTLPGLWEGERIKSVTVRALTADGRRSAPRAARR